MQGYEQLGPGKISFSPVAVSGGGSDLIDVFARGIGANDGVYHKVWQSNVWSDWQRLGSWESLGGIVTSSPASISRALNLIEVFVRGTDSKLYHIWWDGTAWRP